MSRNHHPDNLGMHQVVSRSPQPYGTCHKCHQIKPIHWVSRTRRLCSACMKATGTQPFRPTVSLVSFVPPPTRKNRIRPKLPSLPSSQTEQIKFRYKEPTLHAPQEPQKERVPSKQPQQVQAKKPLPKRAEPRVTVQKVKSPPQELAAMPEARSMQQEPLTPHITMNKREANSQYPSSQGATPETLARWERNRRAVEHARERKLAQELDTKPDH